jgi:hypothetical protein
MIIKFQDWQPDSADYGTLGSVTVLNAAPAQYGFQPWPSFSNVTSAIAAKPLGAIEAFDEDQVSFMYTGSAAKLYQLEPSDLTWTDSTNTGGDYTTAAGERWNFVRWENKILGVNFTDSPQQIAMGAANFSDLTTAFRARNIAVVRDFVVASNTYDSSDGNVPNRVRWSAIGDETDWTVSASTLSDFRDLTTGGSIRKIVGGEVGIIVSERSIFRMSFVGAPTVFQIDEIQPDIGTIAGGSVTNLGDSVFMISAQGFIEVTGGGTGIVPIGAGKIDQWFFEDYDSDYPDRISAIADPANNRVVWSYPGKSNVSGRPNKVLVYDRTFQKWSLIEQEIELLLRSKGFSFTLDQLDALGFTDLDTMTISLDDSAFKALSSQIAGFSTTFKLGFFSGEYMAATLETAESQLNEGYMTALNAFSPMVDGATVTAQIGTRNRLSDSVTWGSSLTQSSSGRFTTRANAKYHRFRLSVTGNDWLDAIGVQIDPPDAPRGSKRA